MSIVVKPLNDEAFKKLSSEDKEWFQKFFAVMSFTLGLDRINEKNKDEWFIRSFASGLYKETLDGSSEREMYEIFSALAECDISSNCETMTRRRFMKKYQNTDGDPVFMNYWMLRYERLFNS
jgi:hypothetical protein